jgi:DNA-binding response OmpR family regulator
VDDREGVIEVEGLRIDADQRRAFLDDVDIALTPTEFRLLLVLARDRGRVMTRDELQQRVWGTRPRHRDRTVDVCIRKVREKLDRSGHPFEYIHTQYGVGYRFAPEAVEPGDVTAAPA